MKKIYKGPMRNLTVSKLELRNGVIQLLEYETPIVKKDLLFYRGLFNSLISLDYDTILPDKVEALELIKEEIENKAIKEAPFPNCTFVNMHEIGFLHEISNRDFKILKKQYKQKRKNKKTKKV